jgi:hypothetical protein
VPLFRALCTCFILSKIITYIVHMYRYLNFPCVSVVFSDSLYVVLLQKIKT